MFNNRNHRLDFADTRAFSAESVLTLHGVNRFDSADTLEQMAQAEAADRNLLRLVLCAAAATLLLALASLSTQGCRGLVAGPLRLAVVGRHPQQGRVGLPALDVAQPVVDFAGAWVEVA